jgi:hypothetical protein
MFTNVFNMMDHSLCEGFFMEYCSADLSMKHIMCDGLSEKILLVAPDSPKIVSIVTPLIAAQYTHIRGQLYPDIHMTLSGSRIIQQEDRGNEESQIVSTFEMEMTKVHQWTEEVDYTSSSSSSFSAGHHQTINYRHN